MAPEIWKTFPPVRRVVTGHDANNVAKVLRTAGTNVLIPTFASEDAATAALT